MNELLSSYEELSVNILKYCTINDLYSLSQCNQFWYDFIMNSTDCSNKERYQFNYGTESIWYQVCCYLIPTLHYRLNSLIQNIQEYNESYLLLNEPKNDESELKPFVWRDVIRVLVKHNKTDYRRKSFLYILHDELTEWYIDFIDLIMDRSDESDLMIKFEKMKQLIHLLLFLQKKYMGSTTTQNNAETCRNICQGYMAHRTTLSSLYYLFRSKDYPDHGSQRLVELVQTLEEFIGQTFNLVFCSESAASSQNQSFTESRTIFSSHDLLFSSTTSKAARGVILQKFRDESTKVNKRTEKSLSPTYLNSFIGSVRFGSPMWTHSEVMFALHQTSNCCSRAVILFDNVQFIRYVNENVPGDPIFSEDSTSFSKAVKFSIQELDGNEILENFRLSQMKNTSVEEEGNHDWDDFEIEYEEEESDQEFEDN
jgi:hypothetical protein